jgi:hypothetical protein
MMKAAYLGRVVTAQEAAHLAAFLKSASAAVPAGAPVPAPNDGLVVVHAGAGVLLLIVAAGIAFAARGRRAGVRARLVRDASRR